jgi:hypothetical protein
MRFCACAENIFLNGGHQVLLVCFLGYLFVSESLSSVCSVAVMSFWFNVLWVVPIVSEVCKKRARTGPMFSVPTV